MKTAITPMRPAAPTAASTVEPRAGRLLSELRKVRKDPSDIEAVHDARVAARRFLAAGGLWAPGAPGWKEFERRLPKLIRRLGRVRNLDVTLEIVQRDKALSRSESEEFARQLRRRRRKERQRLSRWLTKPRLRQLAEEVRELSKVMRRRLHEIRPGSEHLGVYFLRLGRLAAKARRSQDHAPAHEVRRELRRLRYAHETMHWAFPESEFVRAAGLFRQVQELAGEWHDLCILEEYAEELGKKKSLATLTDGLLSRVRVEAKTLSAKFLGSIPQVVALRPRILSKVEP